MRALLSKIAGGPESLELLTLPEPEPGPNQVRITLHACAINYPDLLLIQDLYQMRPPRPFTPGSEIAGVVDKVGEGVEHLRPGDRVIALTIIGGLADKAIVNANQVFPLPAERSFVEGAAIFVTYGTAIHALVDRGRMTAGETVLVLGAAGGVGLAAVDVASALGARTIAAVSTEEKAAVAKAAGADEVVIYGDAPTDKEESKRLANTFKTAVGATGADVVLDPVGGAYCEPAIRAMAWDGRYLVVGFPAGIPSIPLNLVLLKNCHISGVFWGAFVEREHVIAATHVERLFDLWAKGKIAPKISETFTLENSPAAIARLGDRSAVGKLVVEIG